MKKFYRLLSVCCFSLVLHSQPMPGWVFDFDDHSHPLFPEPIGDSVILLSNIYDKQFSL